MHDEPKTWNELEDRILLPAWRILNDRKGSFADAPWEDGECFDQTLAPIFPFDREAVSGIEQWMKTGEFPQMSSTANRIAGLHFDCAKGLARRLPELLGGQTLPESPLPELLRWLLLESYADTAQVALDCMRTDILGGKE